MIYQKNWRPHDPRNRSVGTGVFSAVGQWIAVSWLGGGLGMAGMDWFRWHHGSVTDPKFQLIARKTKSRVADVIAVWAFLLEDGSKNGASVSAFVASECDELLGLDAGQSSRVFGELEERGFISGNRIASPRRYFPAASMRPSGGAWAQIRALIFERDDYTCQYCGTRGTRLECDHITPVADGGQHTHDNLCTACFDCNRAKASQSLAEWEVKRGW